MDKGGFVTERIGVDTDFFSKHIDSVRHFYIYGLLPEMIGKFYTRKPVANSDGTVPLSVTSNPPNTSGQDNTDNEEVSRLLCFCNEPSF